MTAEDISNQAEHVMDILTESYPGYEHILIYDNAPTHLKHPEGSLSVHHMPKFMPKEGHNWGNEVTRHDEDGRTIYHSDGSIEKEKIKMSDARFVDRTPQPLYFPEDHPYLVCSRAWQSF